MEPIKQSDPYHNNPQSISGAGVARPSAGEILQTHKVLRNTYMLLGLTLAWSALAAGAYMVTQPQIGLFGLIGMFVVAFGSLFALHKTQNSPWALAWIFLFTGIFGFLLGPTINFAISTYSNGGQLVMTALGGTGLVFFTLSAYTLASGKRFNRMAQFLFVGLIVALVAMIANIFLQMPVLDLTISCVMVLLMSGYILYDTGEILHGVQTNYILATVSLYLNIYLLFSHLLNLLLAFAGDE